MGAWAVGFPRSAETVAGGGAPASRRRATVRAFRSEPQAASNANGSTKRSGTENVARGPFDQRTAPGYFVEVPGDLPPSPSASAPPPPPPASDRPDSDRDRRRLERLLPVLIKRILETGLEKLAGAPENARNLVNDFKLPKEILSLLLAQLDETKNGLYRVVAKETRDFLEHTNFAEELARVLTTLSFEIKTEVRFIPNDSRLGASPDVRARVRMKKAENGRRSTMPPPPEESDA